MATKEEIKEMEMFLRKENKFPVLINNDGEPALESTNTNPTVAYISVERFMTELEKYEMTIDRINLVTIKKEKLMSGPRPLPAKKPIQAPAPMPIATAPAIIPGYVAELKPEEKVPIGEVKEVPTWTKGELAKKNRKQLQAITKKHDDIAGNSSTEDIRAALQGRAK